MKYLVLLWLCVYLLGCSGTHLDPAAAPNVNTNKNPSSSSSSSSSSGSNSSGSGSSSSGSGSSSSGSGSSQSNTFDMLQWMTPDPIKMAGLHLEGNANPMYTMVSTGTVWWIKSGQGWPADVELYDTNYIYHYATELNWTSSRDYKATYHINTIPLVRRFSKDGDFLLSTDSTIGVYQNCSLTRTFILGDIRNEVHDFGVTDIQGDIGFQHTLKIYYRWGGQGHTDGVYNVQETYTLAQGYGLVGWSTANWNSSTNSYDPPTKTVVFNLIRNGTAVPDFPA